MITTKALRRTMKRARKSTLERMALSAWRVTRSLGDGHFNDESGDWYPPITVILYEGPAFLERQPKPYVVVRTDTALTVQSPHLRLPWDAPRFEIGDIASPVSMDDESALGRSWRITGEPVDSYGVHREYPVEEIVALSVADDGGSGS